MDSWQGYASDVPKPDMWSGVASPTGNQANTVNQTPVPGFPNIPNELVKGSTFGFNDEATAGLAALMGAYDKGSLNGIGNDYSDALQRTRDAEKSYETENPKTALGLQIAGGLAGGFAGSATKTGAAIADSLASGSLSARIAKNALAGAASGGLYGFGTGEGDNRVSSAQKGAELGGAFGAAVPAIAAGASALGSSTANTGKNLVSGISASEPDDLISAVKNNFSSSGDLYQKMRDAGAVLNQNAADSISSNIDSALAKNPFIPQLNPKTVGIVDHLKNAIDENGSIGIDELDQYRRMLSRVGGSEDGFSAGEVKKAIDNVVNNAGANDLVSGNINSVALLNKARLSYSNASRFEDIANLLQKANGDPNRIKAGLSRFVSDPDNLRGWTPEQVVALKNAANTGMGENILKAFGKFGFDFSKSGTGNTVLPSLSAIAGASGVPGGIPLVAGGTLARQGQKYIARGKAQNLLDILQKGVNP